MTRPPAAPAQGTSAQGTSAQGTSARGTSAPGPPAPRTPAGDALTDLVLAVFRLNGRFLEAAERLARPVGLTAAWWQVLAGVLDRPAPVASIARDVGLSRQSVQRVADLLVARGIAEYQPNPHHKRAQLLQPTPEGRRAIAALADSQHRWANRTSAALDEGELRRVVDCIDQLSQILAADER